jgi:hypothetical protein
MVKILLKAALGFSNNTGRDEKQILAELLT